ncbi:MAG: DUF1801 domain-containing protein [Bacteroidota bacterium]
MNPVEGFIIDLPENQREIMWFLHEMLLTFPRVRPRIKYNIPFYEVRKSFCYLNPIGKEAIELAFTRGVEIMDKTNYLKANGRTRVKGILFERIVDIDEVLLRSLIREAISLEHPEYP